MTLGIVLERPWRRALRSSFGSAWAWFWVFGWTVFYCDRGAVWLLTQAAAMLSIWFLFDWARAWWADRKLIEKLRDPKSYGPYYVPRESS